jgi:hypothetical protein
LQLLRCSTIWRHCVSGDLITKNYPEIDKFFIGGKNSGKCDRGAGGKTSFGSLWSWWSAAIPKNAFKDGGGIYCVADRAYG